MNEKSSAGKTPTKVTVADIIESYNKLMRGILSRLSHFSTEIGVRKMSVPCAALVATS